MRVLTDRQIFGDPYEPAVQPPPWEDCELQGRHIRNRPAPDTASINKISRRRLTENRRVFRRFEI